MFELQDRTTGQKVVEVGGLELDRGQRHPALNATLELQQFDLQVHGGAQIRLL
jgi:hypothetical protein